MGRRLTRPRPKQGAHLAQLRKAAGLSQYQLAKLIGQPQGNIAFWEVSAMPPRSDLLPKLAKVLGVKVEDLILPASKNKDSSKSAPAPRSKLQDAFDQVALLPRYQQDKILSFISFFIEQHHQSKPSKSRPPQPRASKSRQTKTRRTKTPKS